MKCPGQDSRYWGPEAIFESVCPECGGPIEFFKDESSRKCRKCGHKILNPKMDFGCAAYCRYASQCLGEDMPPELLAKRSDLLKDRVGAEVKKRLGRNFRGISRALKIVDYTGKILRGENVGPAAPTLAAYLLVFLRQPGNGGPKAADPERIEEFRQLSSEILNRVGTPEEVERNVISILESIAEGKGSDSIGVKCVLDAASIVEIEEALSARPETSDEIAKIIGKKLHTPTGRELAEQITGVKEKVTDVG